MSIPSNETKLGDGNYFDHGDGFKEKKKSGQIARENDMIGYRTKSITKRNSTAKKSSSARTVKILLKTCNTFRVCVCVEMKWMVIHCTDDD